MSNRTQAFLDRWAKATSAPFLSQAEVQVSSAFSDTINAVGWAESLAEAHRLASECIARIRETDPKLADKVRAGAYAIRTYPIR